MSSDDLHYLDLVDVARRIKVGALSPVTLTEAMLQRIEKLDGGLKSYATVTPDLALEQAREAEAEIKRGAYRGPLHGVPIAVKDLCYTKGIPTAAGMAIHKAFKPDHDSTVVERFAQAGAVLLGKLQLTEGAFADHHPSITPPVIPGTGSLVRRFVDRIGRGDRYGPLLWSLVPIPAVRSGFPPPPTA